MKRSILIYILLHICIHSYSQSWNWAKHIHSGGGERATVSCIDGQGNSYTIGGFDSNYSCQFDTVTLFGVGTSTSFLAKYESGGNLVWVKKISYTSSQNCSGGIVDLVYDSISNSLLFTGSICGSFQMNSTIITSSFGSMDAIFGKADLNGDILWYETITGLGIKQGRTIAYDNAGSVYVAGTNTHPIQI
ncbi:MAG TPA: hypothetical protein PKX59_09290 [Bacteroidia bacterium]|nr:hypothetical protein [Bacteroidia bacterium]